MLISKPKKLCRYTIKTQTSRFNLNQRLIFRKNKLKKTQITVTEGSANIDTQTQHVVLQTQQMAIVGEKEVNIQPQSSKNVLAWKNHHLTFENTPLQQVFEDLNLYFNTNIEVEDGKVLMCRFTGDYTEPKLEEILQVITLTLNLKYQKNTNHYLITGKGCVVS